MKSRSEAAIWGEREPVGRECRKLAWRRTSLRAGHHGRALRDRCLPPRAETQTDLR